MSYKTSKVWTGSEWAGIAVAVANSQQKTIGNSAATAVTLSTNDATNAFVFSSNSSITVTIPTNTDQPFLIGQTLIFFQNGTGVVTFSAASGVTLRSKSSYVKTAGQYSEARLIKIATNEWLLSGDLSS
jgi:hypothetical protein